jgi:NADH-quinone oxidoreductase subunit N
METGRRLPAAFLPGKPIVLALLFCSAVFVPRPEAAAFAKSETPGGPATVSSTYQAIAAVPPTSQESTTTGGRYLIEDRLSHTALWVTLGFALLLAVAACDGGSPRIGHRFAILALSLAGVVLAVLANDLILAVLAMELASLPATVLLFVERDMPNSRAAALRSLSLNLFALAMLIAGAAMIGLLSGTTNLGELRSVIPPALVSRRVHTLTVTSPLAGEIGCVLILAGLGVHLFAAPFQLAAAEIFDGAKPWGISLTALLPRGAALLLLVRLLVQGPLRLQGTVQTLFTAVGFLTVLIGSLLAPWQTHIRRLVAYLVLFQSGLILVALSAACTERVRPTATPWLDFGTPGGIGAACLCFAIDSVALVGFLALLASRERTDRPIVEVNPLADALRDYGVRGVAVCILAASLAGMPPFAGFWARIAILQSTLSISVPAANGFLPHQNVDYVVVALAIAGGLILLAPVVLALVKKMLLDDLDAPRIEVVQPDQKVPRSRSETSAVVIGILAALAVIAGGIFPKPVFRATAFGTTEERAISQSSGDLANPLGAEEPKRGRRESQRDD